MALKKAAKKVPAKKAPAGKLAAPFGKKAPVKPGKPSVLGKTGMPGKPKPF